MRLQPPDMNVLQVTLGFYPAVHWGGPVKIVHQNALELLRRGHRVTVLCTNLLDKRHKIRPQTFEDEIDGIRVVYLNTWNIPQWPGTLGPIWLPDLVSRFADEIGQYDVVHLHGYRNLMSQQLLPLLQKHRVPLVIQPHGGMPVIVNSFFIKRLYDRILGQRILQRAQAFIALQPLEKQQILAHGVPGSKITVIPNGLNLNDIPRNLPRGRFRKQFHIPLDVPLILFLGRINRKKGVDMLIEAFARLPEKRAWLAIVGPDDGQLVEAQALVRQYRLGERVVFTGSLSGEIIWSAYQDADLFVLPCRTDTFPTTIMEACALETPMVITEGCEMADLVRGEIADIVPFDADIFADAMQKLLKDRQRYHQYQENCQRLMNTTFSIRATVDRLENLYQRMVHENINSQR